MLILFCIFGLFSFSQYVFLTTYCLLSRTVLLALTNSHSIFFFLYLFFVIDLFIACLLLKQPHSLDLLPGILLFFFLLHVYYLVQSSHILLTYCQEFCFSSFYCMFITSFKAATFSWPIARNSAFLLFIACLLLRSKQPHSLDLLPGILLFFFLLHVYYFVQSSHILLTYCQEFFFSSFIACLLLRSKQPHSLDLLPGILLFFFLLHVYYFVQSSHILLTYCQEFFFSSFYCMFIT